VGELLEADIWSFGGRSSSFEELVKLAFLHIHNREPRDEQELSVFRAENSEMECHAGASWLTHESTLNVLRRVRPQADELLARKEKEERLRREAMLRSEVARQANRHSGTSMHFCEHHGPRVG